MHISPSAACSFASVLIATTTSTICVSNLGIYIYRQKELSDRQKNLETKLQEMASCPNQVGRTFYENLPKLTKLPGLLEATIGLIAASILWNFTSANVSNLIKASVISYLAVIIDRYLVSRYDLLRDKLIKIANAFFKKNSHGQDFFGSSNLRKFSLHIYLKGSSVNLIDTEEFQLFKECVTSETLNTTDEMLTFIQEKNTKEGKPYIVTQIGYHISVIPNALSPL